MSRKGWSSVPPDELNLTLEQAEAARMRSEGHPYHQIAAAQGVNISTALRRCQAAMAAARKLRDAEGEHLLDLDLSRLDKWLLKLELAEKKGARDVAVASNAAVRIIEQRHRILFGPGAGGGNAPEDFAAKLFDALQHAAAAIPEADTLTG